MKFLALLFVCCSAAMSAPLFPKSLDWSKVTIIEDSGQEIKVNSEQEFLLTTVGRRVFYRKGPTTREFRCSVEALFWLFKNQLSTNSHFGDQALKELYKSQIQSGYGGQRTKFSDSTGKQAGIR